jgi:AraC family transcriptional regulator
VPGATDAAKTVDVFGAISNAAGLRFENCVTVEHPYTFGFAEISLHSEDFTKPGGVTHHLLALQLNGGTVHRLDRPRRRNDVGRAGLTTVLPAQAASRWKTDSRACGLNFAVSQAFLAALAAQAFDLDAARLEIRDEYFIPDLTLSSLAHVIRQQLLLTRHPSVLEIDTWGHLVGLHLIRRYSNLPCSTEEHCMEQLSVVQRRRAIDFMQEHLDVNLSLRDVAKSLGMTQYRFARAFRNATGVSVHRSLIDMRLNRARELLSQTKCPLAEIAYACGFSSQSHMTSWFRRKHGMTPNQFRRSVEAA